MILTQVGCFSSLQDIRDMWATGGDGLCLFHTDDDKFTLATASAGTTNGVEPLREVGLTDWSEEIALNVVSASKKSFQVVNKSTGRAEQLAYSVSPLPGDPPRSSNDIYPTIYTLLKKKVSSTPI